VAAASKKADDPVELDPGQHVFGILIGERLEVKYHAGLPTFYGGSQWTVPALPEL
jgi:hypothetical protein